jgi:hypothetical protein
MLNAAVGSELDLGVSLANARESVDFVTRELVASARDTLDGNGVDAEPRDEAIVLGRSVGATGLDGEEKEGEAAGKTESFHGSARV